MQFSTFDDAVLRRVHSADDSSTTSPGTVERIDGARNTAAAPEEFCLTRVFVVPTTKVLEGAGKTNKKQTCLQAAVNRIQETNQAMKNKWHNPNKRKKKPSIDRQLREALARNPELEEKHMLASEKVVTNDRK